MMRAALLLLVLLLATPLAAADHSYSHRLYVSGRIIGDDGLPAAAVPLRLTFHNVSAAGHCFDSKPEASDGFGDFEVCRHAHHIPANASVTVVAGNASVTLPIDPELRMASGNLHVGGEVARDISAQRQFARTYTVVGSSFVLLARPIQEEGITVRAAPSTENVTASLLDGDDTLATAQGRPDEYGRFRLRFDITDVPAAALVRVTAGVATSEETVSTLFRRSDVSLAHDLRLVQGPGEDAPGSQTPLGAGVAVAAVAVAAALSLGRKKE